MEEKRIVSDDLSKTNMLPGFGANRIKPKFGLRNKFDESREVELPVSSDLIEEKLTVVDPAGAKVDRTSISFDPEQLKQGFIRPFKLTIVGEADRDLIIADIMSLLSDLSEFKDRKLKEQFISWICEIFRLPNTAFYNKESMEKAIDSPVKALNSLADAKDKYTEGVDVPKRTTIDKPAFGSDLYGGTL